LRTRRIEVVAHEIPYIPGKQGWLYKWEWRLAPRIVFHTVTEIERFERYYGIRLPKSHIEIRTHHQVFQRFSSYTRTTARRRFGIAEDRLVFLCIGFLQQHKGFHRAMQAFAQANLADAELYVVGSMRVAAPENQQYVSQLRSLVAGRSTTHLIESFVNNEDFDAWITAADWVVLPYSEIWSSGVLARTRLLERPAIVSAVGGLPDQVSDRDLLFSTDAELISAFRMAAREERELSGSQPRTATTSESESSSSA